MTKQEVVQLLAVIRAAWPNFYKGVEGDALSLPIEVWTLALADIEYRDAEMGIVDIMRESKWPPTIAEVIESSYRYSGIRELERLMLACDDEFEKLEGSVDEGGT